MEGDGQVIAVHSVEAWTDLLQKALGSKKLMVVDFTYSRFGSCIRMLQFLADLAKTHPNVIFVEVDIDELKTVADDWAIFVWPTFVFLKEGKFLGEVALAGEPKDQLRAALDKHMSTS